jgi:hypothetical protein
MHRLLFGLLAAGAAATASPVQAQAGAWRVSEVSGDVRIAEGGRTRTATRGALLSGGSIIAGARSRAVLVRGRQYVVVSPGSTLRVDGAPAASGAGMVQMILDAGNAVFKVDRRENPHFRVQTRYLAAVVRGTTFSVTVTPTGGSVQVTEGAVQVSTLDGGASDLIRPGMIAQIGASDLYRLTISGDQERVIRSPKGPDVGSVTTPATPANGVAARGQPVGNGRGREARITAPVGEAPVRLRDTTRGLVDGNRGVAVAGLNARARKPEDGSDHNRGGGNDRAGREDREDRADNRGDRDDRGRGLDRDEREDRDRGDKPDKDKPDNDRSEPDGGGKEGNDGGRDNGLPPRSDDRPANNPGPPEDGENDDDHPGRGDDKDRPGRGDGGSDRDRPAHDDR